MIREIREILIGAATLAVLVGVLAFMNARQDIAAASDRLMLTAKFNKVDGLVAGSAVRLGGIKIGEVASMTLDSQYRAVVTFAIDPGVPLPTDTSAAIHTDGLFGGKFVVLEPGAEEKLVTTGGALTFTQDAVVVSDLLELIISEGKVARGKPEESAK
ncbi:MAG: MlaD family protein [Rhodospirillaceae bacterium]